MEVVYNKIDRVDWRRLSNRFPGSPQVSAVTGEGLEHPPCGSPHGASTIARSACACSSRRGASSPSCTRSGHRWRSARTRLTGLRDRGGPAARPAAVRPVSHCRGTRLDPVGRAPDRDPDPAPARRRRGAGARVHRRCRPRPRGMRARGGAAPGCTRARADRPPPDPEGYAGFVQPAPGLGIDRDLDRQHTPG